METATIHLDLTIHYELNDVAVEELKKALHAEVERAIGNGLLTADTGAVVEEYSMDAEINPDQHREHITSHFQTRLETGNLPAETIAAKMAEYGLTPVGDFIDEMQERGAINPRF